MTVNGHVRFGGRPTEKVPLGNLAGGPSHWKPVYNLLEASFTVLVVNAHHIKTVPGRKTDVKDAAWIAELLRHGLLQGSFIPPLPQRDLRDLTRQRTSLVQERATVVNQLHKVLEWANLKLTSVVTDITGVSARAMLAGILAGIDDVAALADLARGRLRAKRVELEQALTGSVRDHHRFLIAQHLVHLDFLEEQITHFDAQITQQIRAGASAESAVVPAPSPDAASPLATPAPPTAPHATPPAALPPLAWDEAVTLLDTIPGVGRAMAELVIAEVGTDMSRFASAAHLASWAKVCPGNYESAGKRLGGKVGHGNRWLRSALVQAAQAAVKVKDAHFAAVYRRIAARRGAKKAIMAVAHRLLTAISYILLRHEPYRNYEPAVPDARRRTQLVDRLRRRMERLGYTVTIEPPPALAV